MRRQQYLLDTNICAYWLRDKYDVKHRVNAVGMENCYISEVTVAEDMVMVTQNVKDFKNIKGIRIENWISEKQK